MKRILTIACALAAVCTGAFAQDDAQKARDALAAAKQMLNRLAGVSAAAAKAIRKGADQGSSQRSAAYAAAAHRISVSAAFVSLFRFRCIKLLPVNKITLAVLVRTCYHTRVTDK